MPEPNHRLSKWWGFPWVALFAGLALIALREVNGTAQISRDYWWWSVPCAIAGAGLLARLFYRQLVGKICRLGYSSTDIVMTVGGAWRAGITLSILVTAPSPLAFAHALNMMAGVPYTAMYSVSGKYIIPVKRGNCCKMILTREDNPSDKFKICVIESEYNVTTIGEKMSVNGRQSRYVNELFSHSKIS